VSPRDGAGIRAGVELKGERMLKEFKEFISRGNLFELAVAVVLGLAFTAVVQAIVMGIFTPLIAAVFGQSDLGSVTFKIGSGTILIGLVIDALITFLITAFVLFLIVKAYNRAFPKDEAAGPTEVELLTDIRDELRQGTSRQV
jgi:large conductance mechanosensitive channel